MVRIHQVPEALNWELFCEKRPSVDEELVHEFYSNLISSELTEVPVHGIKVPITSNAINEFFELSDFENDKYSSLMSNIEPKNLQEILEKLTVPGSKWTVSKAQPPSPDIRDELSKLMDIMQHMKCRQQAYWKYLKIRDDSMRSALKKIYKDPFIFVPKFLDFIFEPWSPLSKEERGNSCKGNNYGAKNESNSKGSTNK
ncbi:hypothetical protein PVK06_030220 [Gossypium arboreum]|uniref:Putative plant transposon protein domain-containing protein n=1 Tax=Gossypium arboreum TaxID=29729 RepID=A0ABR0NQU0_GOSAR|nr:hypothetical protein PVK06_030220 [Gossypium arboreum]